MKARLDGFNLLFESLTSPATLPILRELPRTDPELWGKISGLDGPMNDGASNGSAEGDKDKESDDEGGKGGKGGEGAFGPDNDDNDNTLIEPAVLMAHMLWIPVPSDQTPGDADGLAPKGIVIPDLKTMSCGKCQKLAMK